MEWLNIYGLFFMIAMLVPNFLYAIRCKEGFANRYRSKAVELAEQIGRFGCIAFMVFNIPSTWFGFPSDEAFVVYLITNTLLVALYCILRYVFWSKNTLLRALSLSILPAAIFLLSGILNRSVLLTLSALLFAPAHIFISYQNCDK